MFRVSRFTNLRGIVQLVERTDGVGEVGGAAPPSPTNQKDQSKDWSFCIKNDIDTCNKDVYNDSER